MTRPPQALGHVARAGTAVEEGDLETWLAEAAAAESIARRRRMVYVEFVLHFVRLNLALLEGDDAAAEAHAEAMRTMRDGIATPALEWTDFGVSYVTAMWRPEIAASWPRGCSSSTRPTLPRSVRRRCSTCWPSWAARTTCGPSSPPGRSSP